MHGAAIRLNDSPIPAKIRDFVEDPLPFSDVVLYWCILRLGRRFFCS